MKNCPNFVKIITGEVEAPKCYTKGKDEIYDKRYIFVTNSQQHTKLSDVLSDDLSRQYARNFKKLRSKITDLEANFMDLKNAVDKNDYLAKSDAKEDINETIPEVLI